MSKSFSAARKAERNEPIAFNVGDETFSVSRPLPGFVVLDLAALDESEGSEAVKAFHEFFKQVLPKDFKRLRDACNAEELPLNPDENNRDENGEDEPSVLGIVQYIIEEGVGHPTQQRSASLKSLSNDSSTSSIAAS